MCVKVKLFRLASSFFSTCRCLFLFFRAGRISQILLYFYLFCCSIERGRRKLETLCSPVGASLAHYCLCVLPFFTRIRVWYAYLAALPCPLCPSIPFICLLLPVTTLSCPSLPSTVPPEAPLGTLGLCYPLLLDRCTALIACLGGQSLAIAPQFIHRRHVSVATTLFDSLFPVAYRSLSGVQSLICSVACTFHLRWRLHAPSGTEAKLKLRLWGAACISSCPILIRLFYYYFISSHFMSLHVISHAALLHLSLLLNI